MHQVLGVDVAARERAGVAAESRKLAEHVEGGRALKHHNPYTELEAELIRQGSRPTSSLMGTPGLGDVVGGVARRAGDPLLGAGVDDRGGRFLVDHRLGEGVDAVDDAPEIYR